MMTDGVSEGDGAHASFLQKMPIVFPGYSIQGFHCDACGHNWNALALVGTVGVECPNCGRYDPGFVWPKPDFMMAHDGAWLTAHWDLPVYSAPGRVDAPAGAGDVDGVDDGMDPETGEPRSFWRRWVQRLLCAWWALRGEY